jgi:hypothetical protein
VDKYLSGIDRVNFGRDIGAIVYRPDEDPYASHELNTYRIYNPMALEVEPIFHGNEGEDVDYMPFSSKTPGKQFEGRHSLFNAVNAVGNELNYQVALNAPLLDTPETRAEIRAKSDCSVKALVNASARGEMGRAIYTYADFMFCKHLGRISNNYLITLRRFPHPPGDHINLTMKGDINEHLPDIGRMVTWMGTPGNDMSSILKYSVNLPYEEMKAEMQDANFNADNSGGFLGGLMNMASGSYKQGMLNGSTGRQSIGVVQQMASPFAGKFAQNLLPPEDNSWAYHKDTQKQYGPVDSITTTHYRQGAEKGGIKFDHQISLTFDYELRSYNGINTRAAMLDLLANILAVTFTEATYWGGAVRGTGAAQSNVFSNLPIFHMNEPLTFANVQDSVFDTIGQIAQTFNNGKPIGGVKDIMNAMGNIMKGVLTGLTAGLLNKLGRPQKNALNSMLNFQPTGLWHLMIGNPKHPIMSMGNMILDSCTIEHYGPLGLDDFPTGLKVTMTLKHGMPRDNLKIEQMYMNGDYRIYHALDDRTYDVWANAEEINSTNQYSTDSPDSAQETAGYIFDSESETTEDIEIKNALNKKRFLKYFGMDNRVGINTAGKEANFGANKRGSKKDSTGSTVKTPSSKSKGKTK